MLLPVSSNAGIDDTPFVGTKQENPVMPCRHNNPVLEMAHLAQLLVRPAGLTAPETPPPAVAVLRRIGICPVGSG